MLLTIKMDSSTESLLCEENLQLDSPWSKDLNTDCIDFTEDTCDTSSSSTLPFAAPEDCYEIVKIRLEKELTFMPSADSFFSLLQANELCDKRRRAVSWMKKVSRHFNFRASTISCAVNYMDRLLSEMTGETWKSWLMQLVSIGCLTIAAKMDEVKVPTLMDFQVEASDPMFDSATLRRFDLAALRRTELIIMEALGWRMSPVTAFSYTEEMAQHLRFDCIVKTSIVSRATELLLLSLSEAEFVEFRPSVVALATMSCALEELVPLQAEFHITELSKLVNADKVDFQRCYLFMEERIVDPLPPALSSKHLTEDTKSPTSPTSPVTVIQILAQTSESSTEIPSVGRVLGKRKKIFSTRSNKERKKQCCCADAEYL